MTAKVAAAYLQAEAPSPAAPSWLQAVKNELPSTTTMRLCRTLSFIVNEHYYVPHPIEIQKYTPNHFTGFWFTAFL
jgi:hypothetical protein